ncbi:MAG: serine hydrolase domain-containing protein [Chloroflexia bacterium]
MRDAGERWEYGANTDWAGRVVERISGQSLEDFFRANILDPLGMGDTSFLLRPDLRARLATCYQRHPDGELEALADTFPERPAVFGGGGGLFSTGADYVRFLQMLLGDGQFDGGRVLQPETVALLAENHVGELDAGDLHSVRPDRSNHGLFFPGMAKRWGLAGMLTTDLAPTGRSAGSWAWAGMYNTYFWLDPARRIAGFVLTRSCRFATSRCSISSPNLSALSTICAGRGRCDGGCPATSPQGPKTWAEGSRWSPRSPPARAETRRSGRKMR